MKTIALTLKNINEANPISRLKILEEGTQDYDGNSVDNQYSHREKALLFLDSRDQVTQSHICMNKNQYWDAFRILMEHCIEDFGREFTCGALDHALYKNNLPPQPSEYFEGEDY